MRCYARSMLAESLVYARSFWRTPPPFRPFLVDAVGLWARGERQFRAWTPHLNKTRTVIDTTIDDIAPRRKVAVLGAGPLFDVPLESLARTFDTVLLIDVAHLAITDERTRRYGNVSHIWRDLAPPGEARPLAFLNDVADLDWVISVNLASQIGRTAPAGEARRAIDAHLDGLGRLRMPATLVTDIDYRVFDRDGTLLEEADLMRGRPLPRPESRWLWAVAPFGEEHPDRRRIHSVVAFPDWPRLSAP